MRNTVKEEIEHVEKPKKQEGEKNTWSRRGTDLDESPRQSRPRAFTGKEALQKYMLSTKPVTNYPMSLALLLDLPHRGGTIANRKNAISN